MAQTPTKHVHLRFRERQCFLGKEQSFSILNPKFEKKFFFKIPNRLIEEKRWPNPQPNTCIYVSASDSVFWGRIKASQFWIQNLRKSFFKREKVEINSKNFRNFQKIPSHFFRCEIQIGHHKESSQGIWKRNISKYDMQIFHFQASCSQMNVSHRVCQLDGRALWNANGAIVVGGRGSPLGPILSRPGAERASTFLCVCVCA